MILSPPAATWHTTYYYDISRKHQGWEGVVFCCCVGTMIHSGGMYPTALWRPCSQPILPVSSHMTILLSWLPQGQFQIWYCCVRHRVLINSFDVFSSWPLRVLSTVLPNYFKLWMLVLDTYFISTLCSMPIAM